jgi:hypothetical protein
MRKLPRWVWVGATLLLLSWLFWFPPTRAILVFLLPLGSGKDDVVVTVLFFVAIFIYWTGLFTNLANIMKWLFKKGR